MTLDLSRSMRFVTCIVAVGFGHSFMVSAQADWEYVNADPTGPWTMVVCADPASMPFSHEDRGGFENELAEILADELGAELHFDWWPQGPTMIRDRLREGECDMILGVPDGHSTLLNTVAYYRSPYVFLYRSDSNWNIESLDDPRLENARIGVQRSGMPPHEALIERGLSGNVAVEYGAVPYLDLTEEGYRENVDRLATIVADVASERIDVGIGWGPVMAYFARQSEADLEFSPVTPMVTPSGVSMLLTMTIGVRAGDEALRDLLNQALAARWDDVRAVLTMYDVPLMDTPRPLLTGAQ